jgi:hypothetical protein
MFSLSYKPKIDFESEKLYGRWSVQQKIRELYRFFAKDC